MISSNLLQINLDIERDEQITFHHSDYVSYDRYRVSNLHGWLVDLYKDNFSTTHNMSELKYFQVEQDRLILNKDYEKLHFKYMPGYHFSWSYIDPVKPQVISKKLDRIKHTVFRRCFVIDYLLYVIFF